MGPNVKKYAFLAILFIFGGSWGALTSNPGLPNFQGSKISLQSRQIYKNKLKKITSFSYMGPNVRKCAFWAIRGGLGGP